MPDDVLNPRAVNGGNNPPDLDPLIIEAGERIDAANRWLTERGNLDEWTDEIADKANGFISQIGATAKELDDQRLRENREHTARQTAKYGQPLSLLDMAKSRLVVLRRG